MSRTLDAIDKIEKIQSDSNNQNPLLSKEMSNQKTDPKPLKI